MTDSFIIRCDNPVGGYVVVQEAALELARVTRSQARSFVATRSNKGHGGVFLRPADDPGTSTCLTGVCLHSTVLAVNKSEVHVRLMDSEGNALGVSSEGRLGFLGSKDGSCQFTSSTFILICEPDFGQQLRGMMSTALMLESRLHTRVPSGEHDTSSTVVHLTKELTLRSDSEAAVFRLHLREKCGAILLERWELVDADDILNVALTDDSLSFDQGNCVLEVLNTGENSSFALRVPPTGVDATGDTNDPSFVSLQRCPNDGGEVVYRLAVSSEMQHFESTDASIYVNDTPNAFPTTLDTVLRDLCYSKPALRVSSETDTDTDTDTDSDSDDDYTSDIDQSEHNVVIEQPPKANHLVAVD